MSTSVQFNDYPSGWTIKISNIRADLLLAAEFDRMLAQKLIPQLVFLLGRILP